MPFMSRSGIDPKMTKPYDKKYKAQLREALGNPGLSAEQRARIKAELAQIGKPRVYDGDRPALPGAIELPG